LVLSFKKGRVSQLWFIEGVSVEMKTVCDL